MASPLCNIEMTMFYSSGIVAKGRINLKYQIKICSLFNFNAIDITENHIFAIFLENFDLSLKQIDFLNFICFFSEY